MTIEDALEIQKLKVIEPSPTRWLGYEMCVKRILEIYPAVQSAPLISTSDISTIRLYARRYSGTVLNAAISLIVNFAYRHQRYKHIPLINTPLLSPSWTSQAGNAPHISNAGS
jgi:hypothetical protein